MNNACDCLGTYTDDKSKLCAFYLKVYKFKWTRRRERRGRRGNHNDLDLSSDKRHGGL